MQTATFRQILARSMAICNWAVQHDGYVRRLESRLVSLQFSGFRLVAQQHFDGGEWSVDVWVDGDPLSGEPSNAAMDGYALLLGDLLRHLSGACLPADVV